MLLSWCKISMILSKTDYFEGVMALVVKNLLYKTLEYYIITNCSCVGMLRKLIKKSRPLIIHSMYNKIKNRRKSQLLSITLWMMKVLSIDCWWDVFILVAMVDQTILAILNQFSFSIFCNNILLADTILYFYSRTLFHFHWVDRNLDISSQLLLCF